MKKIVTIQIKSIQSFTSNFQLKCLGMEIKKQVEAAGAKCLPIWANSVLTLAVEGLPPSAVEAMMAPFLNSVTRHGGALSIVQRDTVSAPKGGLPVHFSRPGAILRERLTRQFLFRLPAGAYVVSNVYPNGRSAFAEELGDPRSRAASWQRAVAAGAAQRLCQVVWTKEEFDDAVAGRLL